MEAGLKAIILKPQSAAHITTWRGRAATQIPDSRTSGGRKSWGGESLRGAKKLAGSSLARPSAATKAWHGHLGHGHGQDARATKSSRLATKLGISNIEGIRCHVWIRARRGFVWHGIPFQAHAIPAKAGIQCADSAFAKASGVGCRFRGNDERASAGLMALGTTTCRRMLTVQAFARLNYKNVSYVSPMRNECERRTYL